MAISFLFLFRLYLFYEKCFIHLTEGEIYGMIKKDNVYDSFNKLESIWDEYNVYEKVDKQ